MTKIKEIGFRLGIVFASTMKETIMTFLNALALVGIISAFVVFAVAVAWADYYSRSGPKPAVDAHPRDQDRAADMHDERRAA